MKNTKSQQSEHHNHKESHDATLEEETSLDQGTEGQGTVSDPETIDLANQEEDLEDEMINHVESSEGERDLALEKTDLETALETETVTMHQEAEIVTIGHETALEIQTETEIILEKIDRVKA